MYGGWYARNVENIWGDIVNWDAIILALIDKAPSILTAIGAIVAAIASIVAAWTSRTTHQAVNGQMSKMLELTATASEAKGKLDEKAAEQHRKGDAAITKADQAG